MFKTDVKNASEKTINKMLSVSSRLKKVSASEFSGWSDYILILDGYVNNLLDMKKNFNLSSASDEEINRLKLYDRDVWLINNFIKKIPFQFITDLENEIKKRQEEDEFNKMMEES